MENFQKKYLKYQKKYDNQKRKIISKAIKKTYRYLQQGGAAGPAQQSEENIELLELFSSLLICPITQQIMVDPVITSDGQTYEREAIEQWLTTSRKSPLTNVFLANSTLIPNIALKNIIENIIEQGLVSLKEIQEYYSSKGIQGSELTTKKNLVIKNKIKNSNLKLFDSDKILKITAIHVNYEFDPTNRNNIIKYVNIIYNCKKYIRITYAAETRDGKISSKYFFDREEIKLKDLDFKHESHIQITSDKLKDELAILDNPSGEEMMEIIELLSNNLLDESDFFKVIKDKQLDKVRISPRMKHNPTIYSFILPQTLSPIFNKLYKEFFISELPIIDFHKLGDNPEELHTNALLGLEGRKMLSISDEERNSLVIEHIRLLNEKFGHTFYTQYGILMEDVPDDKKPFYVAFTGDKGVGKTYITQKLIKPELIFETDSTTKENFKRDYQGQPVIVVGQKDPSFNLEYIREVMKDVVGGIPVYECRIVNLSDKINIEENLRLERLEREREEARRRQIAQREEQSRRQIRQRSERLMADLDPDKVYVIAYREEDEEGEYPNPSWGTYTDTFYYLYLSNGTVIKLSNTNGECMSGWTSASYGNVEFNYSDWMNDEEDELVRENRLIEPLEYLGYDVVGSYGPGMDTDYKLNFSDGVEITVSEDGGDGYYPMGYVGISDGVKFRTVNDE